MPRSVLGTAEMEKHGMAQIQAYILPEERRKGQVGDPEMSSFRRVVNAAVGTVHRDVTATDWGQPAALEHVVRETSPKASSELRQQGTRKKSPRQKRAQSEGRRDGQSHRSMVTGGEGTPEGV